MFDFNNKIHILVPIHLFTDVGGISNYDINRIYLAEYSSVWPNDLSIKKLSKITPETKIKEITNLISIQRIHDNFVVCRQVEKPYIPLT